jgi:hypothetical protein
MISSKSLASVWGATASEQAMSYPCDRYLRSFDGVDFRAVEVNAPASLLFRWLCQLKVAPYSYDWIDNRGGQSPRRLVAGLENLEIGQRVMTIFRLVDFAPDQHITLQLTAKRARKIFGEIAVSYVIIPQTEQGCRLVVKMLVCYPPLAFWSLMRWFLPWGDLLMMRKQLLTLKELAERQAREETKI